MVLMPGCPLEYHGSFKNIPIPVSPSEILILKSWDGTPGLCTFPRGFSCAAWAQNHYSKRMFSQQPFGHDFETCLSSCGERMWVTPHRYPARCVHRARGLQTSVAPAILSSGICGRECRQTKGCLAGTYGSPHVGWKRISRHRVLQKGVSLVRTKGRDNMGTRAQQADTF